MADRRVTVGLLSMGVLSPEQRAAYEWCADAFRTERLGVADLEGGPPSGIDVLWWHRDEPLWDEARIADAGSGVRSFLASGGGLLLSLRALEAVSVLGIDPIPPDVTGSAAAEASAGYLFRSVHADHPIVDAFDDLRVPMRPPVPAEPYARYEDVLPRDGTVLASTVRGSVDCPREMTVLAWDDEGAPGRVVGAGAGLAFAPAGPREHANNRDRFVRTALGFLGREAEPTAASVSTSPATLRARLADDPHRPRYHISPPANWLNDPNGLVHWNGCYHVFYQYNPAGPFHNTIHWGHAVSEDLVHWRDEPVALTPEPDRQDRDGCWSGCTVVEDGTPTVLYTGGRGRHQLPCLATASDPDLRRWTKHDGNPVIESAPAEVDVLETEHWAAEFRDHSVWRADGRWYQIIGSGVAGVGGAVLLYAAEDLRDWEFVGPALVGDWEDAGRVWETPELLDFGDRQLLHVSDTDRVEYFLGELDRSTGRFEVERRGRLDYGNFYAPQSMRDDRGRTLMWGWIPEDRSERAQWDAGWAGLLSLPRVLTVEDGTVRQRPAPELRDLRTARLHEGRLAVPPGEPPELDVRGRALEFRLRVALGNAEAVELDVLAAAEERTRLRVTEGGDIVLDRSDASRDAAATNTAQRLPIDADPPLDLRVFLDGSVIEVFANERRCLTSRVYPTDPDSRGVSVRAVGDTATFERFDVWRLGSAWPDSSP